MLGECLLLRVIQGEVLVGCLDGRRAEACLLSKSLL